ncbi:hypothetical protein BKA82DRAFT_995990 [Pisolithus tinctorius]|uniref:RPA43 OB domain-containing protein n=1 Tax=Pisolithus tinctorius Marx 270 TaxID=870435 RepID=A0A0C3PNM4_PISTI|nr:hypothetical protein BKA82DRAFT_995990 [Pisolithus tinctorius]KIO10009.1 hypothetical protein M404DRAFT_995990 [Pisolithus tinctorius Marx 270]
MLSSPASHKSKKRKQSDAADSSPITPKVKKKKRASSSSSAISEFCTVNATTVLSVPPIFANNLRAGVEELLDSMVMRHIPSLQGVFLAHSNTRFLSRTAMVRGDCPFAICNVGFDATVWSPRVGMKLVGKINLYSPDHVSVLVHRTFNVSIPRHHIPCDQWTFEYGPAKNDPEFGPGRDSEGHESSAEGEELTSVTREIEMQDVLPDVMAKQSKDKVSESSGRWVHHLTGKRLGDPDGYLEFTVIGLTVANEMLSLQGSIQADPFSPEHVLHRHSSPRASAPSSPTSRRRHHVTDATTSSPVLGDVGPPADEGEEEEFGEDTFTDLVRLEREAAEGQRKEPERVEKRTKKRKLKEDQAGANEKDAIGGNRGRGKEKREKKRMKQKREPDDVS